MEGIYYWSILQVLLLTAGEIINVGAGMIIRNNLSYFTSVSYTHLTLPTIA